MINRTFTLADFDEAREGVKVEALVFVECDCAAGRYLDELAWNREQASANPRLHGILPHLPLWPGVWALDRVFPAALPGERLSRIPKEIILDSDAQGFVADGAGILIFKSSIHCFVPVLLSCLEGILILAHVDHNPPISPLAPVFDPH